MPLNERDMSDPNEWPTCAEELTRKALDKLHEAVWRHTRKMISARELFLVSDTLYDACIGLTPHDVTDVIYKVRQAAIATARSEKRA